jgi:predicted metal-dependent hydrolase
MTETLRLGDVAIAVARKDVKHVHLSVHPPNGRVTLVAPLDTRLDVVRAYAAAKLGWIRKQQDRLREQARETPRRYIERESHHLWGRRYLMPVLERQRKPEVSLDHRRIILSVRSGSSQVKRADVLHEWHKALLHREVPPIIRRWEPQLGVDVRGYFLQRMKTKWGSCNRASGTIRLNTELVKKPKDLLEYVIVHEMAHLIEPTHSSRFVAILDEHYPKWRDARVELNDLPLAAEAWQE